MNGFFCLDERFNRLNFRGGFHNQQLYFWTQTLCKPCETQHGS